MALCIIVDVSEAKHEQTFACALCGNRTSQRVLCVHTPGWWEDDEHEGHWEAADYNYLAVVCSSCDGFAVYTDGHQEDEVPEVVYPMDRTLGPAVPKEIQEIYDEAFAVKDRSPNSFAVQIRKGLEAICADKSVAGANLHASLSALVARLAIPADLASLSNALRLLGNMGAHYGMRGVSQSETTVIDGFFRAIVEYVYVAPAKMNRYQSQLNDLGLALPIQSVQE